MRPRLLALAAVAAALALAAPAAAVNPRASLPAIEAQLVCPTCHEPLDESSSPVAEQMKNWIRKHIAMGWTEKRIIDSLVGPPNNLGPAILGVPSKHGFDLLAWALPIGGIVAGGLALGAGAWIWSRNRSDPRDPSLLEPALDPALERRVDEALARFE